MSTNTAKSVESGDVKNDFGESESDIQDSMCLLDDDTQCGYIFFSEFTRVLKFYCTYCQKVTDNINFFCEHLSQHVNDNEATNNSSNYAQSADDTDADADVDADADADVDANADDVESKTVQNPKTFNNANQSLVPPDLAGFDESKMVVEELDEAEEIAAEVEAEMRQELESEQTLVKDDNSCSNDFFGYEETASGEAAEQRTERSVTTDYEKLIDTAGHQPPALRPSGKKKKRVTTVKVIALKNRVAELYERIKSEEERRSRVGNGIIDLASPENSEENASTAHSSTLEGEDEPTPTPSMDTTAAPVRQIIGETVITLLPPTEVKQHLAKFPGSSVPQSMPLTPAQQREDNKTTCPACGRKFRNAFSLTIHKRTHYLESDSNVKLAHKCSDCDQLFNKITDLKDHIQEVHYPEGFICKICNKKLTSLTLLETHMRKVHLSRPFSCEICHKNFENRDLFDEHVRGHIAGQPYRCDTCGRKYSTERILEQHMRRHKEQVPQCCVVCGKMTLRITQHMKIHAPRPKRVLSCKVCGKIFNFSSGLSHHFKIMHKLPRPPPKLKRERHESISSRRRQKKLQEEQECSKEEAGWQTSEDIMKKEEEAKRVIVELIQNSTYTSFFPETIDSGPPIAREETISAVNSIVSEGDSVNVTNLNCVHK